MLEPQTAARLLAVGRIAVGAALLAAPERVLTPWIGRDGGAEGVKVIGTALGVRDLAIGAGQLSALLRDDAAGGWLRAGAASDLVDLAATLRAREHLPRLGVVGTGLMAATGAAAGAWLQRAV